MWISFCLIIFLSLSNFVDSTKLTTNHSTSFEIDYENNQFLLDGKPFRFISGSFHYFRTPKQYWRDRLRKMRAAGLNAVSTYVEWSFHQPEPNKWIWDDDADIVEFIKLAQEENLLVLLRPGPYICAERDFGGFPYWLLSLIPDIKLRTNDERYLKYVEEYMNQVLTRVKPLLRGKGGPIIMVQIENEYGSFHACDHVYMSKLRDIIKHHVRNDALLYTTDGTYREALHCGPIPGAYTTVDFGTSGNVTKNFNLMREFQPKGPLVNSEFYCGWPTYWGKKFERVDINKVTKLLDEMLYLGASVNLYMFYGGTNFGFTSGADIFDSYYPDISSYDYDAPLDEAGDPTLKYFAIKQVISKYLPLPNITIPSVKSKENYGTVTMKPALRLFDPEALNLYSTVKVKSDKPLTFEALNLSNWLVLYGTNLPTNESAKDKVILSASPRDRALIYLDSKFFGTLSRTRNIETAILKNESKHLMILVENQGRVNYGNKSVEDFKGLLNVSLNGIEVLSWNITGFKFDRILESTLSNIQTTIKETQTLLSGPQILIGYFNIPDDPRDTYLNTMEWGKGVAFINNHNIGRYWPLEGPQITLYIPAAFLKRGKNTLVLVELEYVPKDRKIIFQSYPILDY